MIYFADTITRLDAGARDAVIVSGSHGGLYPAYLAAKAQARAVILNDAGVGKDGAGIASLGYLQQAGTAAATVAHTSCRIGDTEDMKLRGVVSHCNEAAYALGVRPGMACLEAAHSLEAAPLPSSPPLPVREGRLVDAMPLTGGSRRVVLVDSASLVAPEDAGQIVVTGSHGGLIGGVAAKALAVDAWAAVFHDAGVGIDRAGTTRLAALDVRNIAAVTVDASSARIGDARSVLEDGVLSFVNELAAARGARVGQRLYERLADWCVAP